MMPAMGGKMKIKVPSDRARAFQKEYGDMCEVIPVDLNGKIVPSSKNTDIQSIIDDSNQVYGLGE